jgi:hypothetical protein
MGKVIYTYTLYVTTMPFERSKDKKGIKTKGGFKRMVKRNSGAGGLTGAMTKWQREGKSKASSAFPHDWNAAISGAKKRKIG